MWTTSVLHSTDHKLNTMYLFTLKCRQTSYRGDIQTRRTLMKNVMAVFSSTTCCNCVVFASFVTHVEHGPHRLAPCSIPSSCTYPHPMVSITQFAQHTYKKPPCTCQLHMSTYVAVTLPRYPKKYPSLPHTDRSHPQPQAGTQVPEARATIVFSHCPCSSQGPGPDPAGQGPDPCPGQGPDSSPGQGPGPPRARPRPSRARPTAPGGMPIMQDPDPPKAKGKAQTSR